MANPEHLAILKKGVEAWNRWRQVNPEVRPDLGGVNIYGLKINKADLRQADLRRADLRMAELNESQLSSANLDGADLMQVQLKKADLRRATLYRTNLGGAQLDGANLMEAQLVVANISVADLKDANFTRVEFGITAVGNVDLSTVKGLETVRHHFASSIGIDTIYKSKGKIPEVFLRGCGVPESFITYMHSLVGQPIQFYSCFISFTEKDDAFSQRLYNDLQAAGVRCWRWKEDAKWGKSIWGSVDEAVRLYDKLVVVCSKHSLGGKAPAVIREIERALQKEDDHTRAGKPGDVLFPIRLDDHLFKTWQHPRKADVQAKHVGDFRKWKDPAAYQTALKRLIRDLEAEPSKDGPRQ